jgi:hypothetical protein
VKENNKSKQEDGMRSRRITLADGRYMIFYTFPDIPRNDRSTLPETGPPSPAETPEEKNV